MHDPEDEHGDRHGDDARDDEAHRQAGSRCGGLSVETARDEGGEAHRDRDDVPDERVDEPRRRLLGDSSMSIAVGPRLGNSQGWCSRRPTAPTTARVNAAQATLTPKPSSSAMALLPRASPVAYPTGGDLVDEPAL